MKKKILGRKTITITSIFVILGFLFILFLAKQTNNEREEIKNNNLPAEVKYKIEELFLNPEAITRMGTTRWSVNYSEKRIDVFVWKLTPENEKFDGIKIDGWVVRITEDTELKEEIDNINTKLESLRRRELWLSSWIISYDPKTGIKTVTVWAYNLTDEAKSLDNTTIDGWRIRVYKSIFPPREIALSDPRIKDMLRGQEYEITEVKTRQIERKLLTDVYIHIKEPEKTIVATVDVVDGKVIRINETGS